MSTTDESTTEPASGARIIRPQAALDDVIRHFVLGYELDGAEVLDIRYAMTDTLPRRVWFEITIREGAEGRNV